MLKVLPPVLLVLCAIAAPTAAAVDPECYRVSVTLDRLPEVDPWMDVCPKRPR